MYGVCGVEWNRIRKYVCQAIEVKLISESGHLQIEIR